MGRKFFQDWALWEKMTFVLACGIVVTFIGGLCKLKYSHWKMRKYNKVAATEAAQKPEVLEAQQPPEEVQEEKDEIPFGIRAIESGIEVDGVWISRNNTPVPSSASSICNEPRNRQNGTSPSCDSIELELPQPVHGSSSRASSFDRAVSAEQLPDSRPSSPRLSSSTRGRQAMQTSQSRYSSPNLLRHSSTLNALEGLDSGASYATGEPSSGKQSSASSGKSSHESDESDYNASSLPRLQQDRPYGAAYLSPRVASAPPIDPRVDLDLLQSHRLSHVAETGQLTPRIRKPGFSGEWASVAESGKPENAAAGPVDYFIPRRSTPSPPLSAALGPQFSPSQSTPVTPSSQDSYPNNAAKQAVPLPDTYQPRGPHTEEEDVELSQQASVPQVHRNSQVLRKVNSGFEILRPGTFSVTMPPADDDRDLESGEKRQSKRLQKKRRPSEGYKASNFVEQV